ncbi:MAG: glutaredoxin 3 [Planktomarina sp.]|nr:glutaredoxin 3 [Planktomarina sp.]|tara:strand:+ start:120 stop:377 length:258 start_codon:yes stop_codon:yes gene_type:complete
MLTVELYTSPFCGYCIAAKRLLSKKGISFLEVDLSLEPSRRSEMLSRAHGKHTVPQIFINNQHVGGCDELYELDQSGELVTMLTK